MGFRHGKDTFVSIDGEDISEYSNNTDFNDGVDGHETTTYGRQRKTHFSGLGDGKVTISGVSDDAANGPRKVFKPLMAARAQVPFVFRPFGAGTGKQQSLVDVLVMAYNESAPVGDMAKWTAELQMTGDLVETDQA